MKERPRGVQCLVRWGRGLGSCGAKREQADYRKALALPWIRGMVVRLYWRNFYREGLLSWDTLDEAVEVCRTHGKYLHLMVAPGFYSPTFVLSDPNVEKRQFPVSAGPLMDEIRPLPVPWDQAYLDHWMEFIGALGSRYDSECVIRCISITGPNSHNGEVNLGHSGGGGLSAQQVERRWLNLAKDHTGRTGPDRPKALSDLLVPAWQRCFDGFRDAFPMTHATIGVLYNPVPVKLEIERLETSGDPAKIAAVKGIQRSFKRALMNRGTLSNPPRFGIQTNGMDKGPPGSALKDEHWAAIAERGRRGSLTGYQSRHRSLLYKGAETAAEKVKIIGRMVDNVLELEGDFLQVYLSDVVATDGRAAALIRAQASM